MRTNIIQTSDPKMRNILDMVESFASSKASVLVQGESGTGKELLARYIHAKSARAGKEFVAINCAAVPDNLLESELFGYEKGAFTGAEQRKIGKFELANGSTFLLDEISEMPVALQAKLLRVLQEGEVQRVGGNYPVPVNVRIIATTNRNLIEMIEAGEFREDLYYRLNVIPIHIPSLRSRPKDIQMLARLFLESSCEANGLALKSLSVAAEEKLLQWKWIGNVRELQNVIERSALISKSSELSAEDVLIKDFTLNPHLEEIKAGMTVAETEKLLILKTLEYTGQNRTQAAHLLGISIRTLRNKINEYRGSCKAELLGLDPLQQRSSV